MQEKVYTLGIVIENYGENIEPPIFTSIKSAINYMEDIIISNSPGQKFERDDTVLDKNEKARWYELRAVQQLKNNKIIISKKIFRRNGDYYRVFERKLI